MKNIKEAQANIARDFDEANLWLNTRDNESLHVKYDADENVLVLEGDAGVILAALIQKVKALKGAVDILLEEVALIRKEKS